MQNDRDLATEMAFSKSLRSSPIAGVPELMPYFRDELTPAMLTEIATRLDGAVDALGDRDALVMHLARWDLDESSVCSLWQSFFEQQVIDQIIAPVNAGVDERIALLCPTIVTFPSQSEETREHAHAARHLNTDDAHHRLDLARLSQERLVAWYLTVLPHLVADTYLHESGAEVCIRDVCCELHVQFVPNTAIRLHSRILSTPDWWVVYIPLVESDDGRTLQEARLARRVFAFDRRREVMHTGTLSTSPSRAYVEDGLLESGNARILHLHRTYNYGDLYSLFRWTERATRVLHTSDAAVTQFANKQDEILDCEWKAAVVSTSRDSTQMILPAASHRRPVVFRAIRTGVPTMHWQFPRVNLKRLVNVESDSRNGSDMHWTLFPRGVHVDSTSNGKDALLGRWVVQSVRVDAPQRILGLGETLAFEVNGNASRAKARDLEAVVELAADCPLERVQRLAEDYRRSNLFATGPEAFWENETLWYRSKELNRSCDVLPDAYQFVLRDLMIGILGRLGRQREAAGILAVQKDYLAKHRSPYGNYYLQTFSDQIEMQDRSTVPEHAHRGAHSIIFCCADAIAPFRTGGQLPSWGVKTAQHYARTGRDEDSCDQLTDLRTRVAQRIDNSSLIQERQRHLAEIVDAIWRLDERYSKVDLDLAKRIDNLLDQALPVMSQTDGPYGFLFAAANFRWQIYHACASFWFPLTEAERSAKSSQLQAIRRTLDSVVDRLVVYDDLHGAVETAARSQIERGMERLSLEMENPLNAFAYYPMELTAFSHVLDRLARRSVEESMRMRCRIRFHDSAARLRAIELVSRKDAVDVDFFRRREKGMIAAETKRVVGKIVGDTICDYLNIGRGIPLSDKFLFPFGSVVQVQVGYDTETGIWYTVEPHVAELN